MKRLLKWSLLGLFVTAILATLILGPGRFYGLLKSRQFDGQIAELEVVEQDENGAVKTYLVKLNGRGDIVHVFASSDKQWLMVKQDDWVRVRLYPAEPWSYRDGQWQNASLVAKLLPPKPEEIEPDKSTSAKPTPAKSSKPRSAPTKPTQTKTPIAKPKQVKPTPVTPKQKTQVETALADKKSNEASSENGDRQTVPRYQYRRPRGIWRRR